MRANGHHWILDTIHISFVVWLDPIFWAFQRLVVFVSLSKKLVCVRHGAWYKLTLILGPNESEVPNVSGRSCIASLHISFRVRLLKIFRKAVYLLSTHFVPGKSTLVFLPVRSVTMHPQLPTWNWVLSSLANHEIGCAQQHSPVKWKWYLDDWDGADQKEGVPSSGREPRLPL